MLTVSVLSRVTLVITITAGVVQAKILYFMSAFVLSSEREHAACPVCRRKKETRKEIRKKRTRTTVAIFLLILGIFLRHILG